MSITITRKGYITVEGRNHVEPKDALEDAVNTAIVKGAPVTVDFSTLSWLVDPGAAPIPTPSPVTQTKTFTPNNAIFGNPRRGLYGTASSTNDTPDPMWSSNAKMTVEWVLINLDDYRDKPLDQAKLDEIMARMKRVQSKNMTADIRFRYSEQNPVTMPDGSQVYNLDAPIDVVLGHIAQVGPILAPFLPWIDTWQVGWACAWGETHIGSNGSSNNLVRGSDANGGYMTQIIQAMHKALPEAYVGLRRLVLAYKPSQSISYPWGFLDTPPDPSDPVGKRMSFYNDCLGAGQQGSWRYAGDGFTQAERDEFYAAATAFTPTRGETCGDPTSDSADATILAYMAHIHLDGLHDSYSAPMMTAWSQATRDEVARKLGYRYALTKATVSVAGGQLTLTLEMRNDGWGNYYSTLPLSIGITDANGNRAEVQTSADVHADLPAAGQTATLTYTIPAQSGALDIKLLDPSGMPVRFANDGWNQATGANGLGMTV